MDTSMISMLGSLPHMAGVTTRQISAENPTGEKGGGCRCDPDPDDPELCHSGAASDLGRGWKVRAFIRVPAGDTITLADIEGPGCINELFLTSDLPGYRSLVLRFYWDEDAEPAAQAPMGDFFAMGHDGHPHLVQSLPVTVGPKRACNSYWQMPFRKHARLTVSNEGAEDANVVAYTVLYKLHDVPDDAAYFHAQWRAGRTSRERPEHVILKGVQGGGVYVGTALAWTTRETGWWGEGEVKFYIDGDEEFPTIAGSGTEDYFGGAWGFSGVDGREQPFNSPFLGLPLADQGEENGPRRFSMYRWHIMDPIRFERDLKVTIQALGWGTDGKYKPLTDDIASVAYWYQQA